MYKDFKSFLLCFRTIPELATQCKNYDCNTDTEYGMNENYDYYLNCKLRQRNMGLFTADQVLILLIILITIIIKLNTGGYFINLSINYDRKGVLRPIFML